MKKTFNDPAAREHMITRVNKITPDTQRLWGKMRPDQAVRHLNNALSYSLGDYEIPYKGNFMLALLKPLVLRMPMPKGRAETFAAMRAEGTYDIEAEKKRFAELIQRYINKASMPKQPVSPLLGKMNLKEWGMLDYVHTDHHLKQFGV